MPARSKSKPKQREQVKKQPKKTINIKSANIEETKSNQNLINAKKQSNKKQKKSTTQKDNFSASSSSDEEKIELKQITNKKVVKKQKTPLEIKYEQYKSQYAKIKQMRESKGAAVDTMGSRFQHDQTADINTQSFQSLVSLILTTQTKIETSHKIMQRLIKFGLTLDKIQNISEPELKELIRETRFNNTKARQIKKLVNIVLTEYNGKVPDEFNELIKLPGVGPKIAILSLQIIHNKNVGICVDTHVHRISNRLNWVKTDKPEDTRHELEKFVDKENWFELNQVLVGFGQTLCDPLKPKCEQCLLNKECAEGIKRLKNQKKFKEDDDISEYDDSLDY